MSLLSIQHVSHCFGPHRVLHDVSLQLESGVVAGLLGLNGAGKTTLIRIVNGMLRPDGGTVLWDGRPLRDDDRLNMGYLPEERGLYPRMRVDEQLCHWGCLKGLSAAESRRRAARWLERLGVPEVSRRLPLHLSKGTQQKVQLAAALLHDPGLVVLDEPFSGLDPLNAQLLAAVVAELRARGAAVLISSHNMAFVEKVCDRLAVLHAGRICFDGTLDSLRHDWPQASLSDVFLHLVAPDATQEPML